MRDPATLIRQASAKTANDEAERITANRLHVDTSWRSLEAAETALDQALPGDHNRTQVLFESAASAESDADQYLRVRAYARDVFERIFAESGIATEAVLAGKISARQQAHAFLQQRLIALLRSEGEAGHLPLLNEREYLRLIDELIDWQFGLGVIDALCRIPGAEDVCINTRREGDKTRVEAFVVTRTGKRAILLNESAENILNAVRRLIGMQGKTLTTANPIVDATLPDGRRLNAVIDPIVDGAFSITIRIPSLSVVDFNRLVANHTLTPSAASFLAMAVHASVSVLIAGGTGAGKTSLLNALSQAIDPSQRVVCIEDTRELNIQVPDTVYMQTRHKGPDDPQNITARRLVANALRQRPNRIILGEVRGGEAWDAVKATNTGHSGTLITIHSDSGQEAMIRLQQLATEAPEIANMSRHAVLQAIASAFRLIVHVQAIRDQEDRIYRVVRQIAECAGIGEQDRPVMIPLYEYNFNTRTLERTLHRPSPALYQYLAEHGYNQEIVNRVLTDPNARLYEEILERNQRKLKAMTEEMERVHDPYLVS